MSSISAKPYGSSCSAQGRRECSGASLQADGHPERQPVAREVHQLAFFSRRHPSLVERVPLDEAPAGSERQARSSNCSVLGEGEVGRRVRRPGERATLRRHPNVEYSGPTIQVRRCYWAWYNRR